VNFLLIITVLLAVSAVVVEGGLSLHNPLAITFAVIAAFCGLLIGVAVAIQQSRDHRNDKQKNS